MLEQGKAIAIILILNAHIFQHADLLASQWHLLLHVFLLTCTHFYLQVHVESWPGIAAINVCWEVPVLKLPILMKP